MVLLPASQRCKKPCFCWSPYCVGGPVFAFPLLLLAFILSWAVMLLLSSFFAAASFAAAACIPAVAGVFHVASISADPGVSIVAGAFSYCTVQ
jgi:hypothetical protein